MVDFEVQSFDLRPYEDDGELSLHVISLELIGASDPLEIQLPKEGLRVATKSEEIPVYEYLEDHPLDHWAEIQIGIEVNPESSPEGTVIQATCEKTRFEQVWSHTGIELGKWELKLPTSHLRDIVAIRAVSIAGPPLPTGLIQGESPFLLIRVDRPSQILGGGVRAEWSGEAFINRKGLLTFVDFSNPGEPIVYLNDRIRDFRALMTSHKRSVIGGLRTFLLSQIEVDIWISLGQQAAAHMQSELAGAGLDLDDEDLSDEEIVELPTGVVIDCLRTMAGLCGARRDPNPILAVTRRLVDGNFYEELRGHVAARKKGGVHSTALSSLIKAVADSTRS